MNPQPFQACMDTHYPSGYEHLVQVEPYRQDATSLDDPGLQSEYSQRHPSTSPLPSSQWARSSRPREFGAFKASNPNTGVSDAATIHRTRSIGSGFRMQAPASRTTAHRQRRRPRPLDQERLREPLDSAMLYPHLSPYADPNDDFGYDSFDDQPRSVSQPVTPGLMYARTSGPGPHITTLPNDHPVRNVRYGQDGPPAADVAFDDEYEFRLFVEATAGLGPIPSIDRGASSSESPIDPPEDSDAFRHRDTRSVVSPIAETPTTIQAMQHIAQMPQISPSPPPERPHLRSFGSNFETWLQPPPSPPGFPQRHSMPHMSAQIPMASWQHVPEDGPFEDELPDYAASQAQAQAAQRVEATQRAQELQRRWAQSGSHTIRYA